MNVGSLDVWTPSIRAMVEHQLPAGFAIQFASSYDPDEQREIARRADFLLVGWAEVSGEMIRTSEQLRMIQKWGIGIDRIDLDTARREGVVVAITAGSNASAVAEHTVLLMLSVYRRLPLLDQSIRDGRWLFSEMRERCSRLRGKTVGLVGFGSIGRMVATKLAGFEIDVIYYDPVRADPAVEQRLAASYRPFESLLEQSDLVSLHLPGGARTRHLIDAEVLARMKPGAVLINTARGELVDEEALCDALASGRLLGAGLDTFDPEPPAATSRLLDFDQVVLTPHTAASVIEDVEDVAKHAFTNMETVLRGGPLPKADRVVTPSTPRWPPGR